MTVLCSLSVCHPGRRAKRADPGPKYPGIGNQAEAGVLGSRLSRLTALGRDDKSKGRVICDSRPPFRGPERGRACPGLDPGSARSAGSWGDTKCIAGDSIIVPAAV